MFVINEPIHIKKDADIADSVIMPGDPLRAKYIAENFLENYEEVTNIRNMLGYTGYYKGKKITVMGSGMGMPSMSIYATELFRFFNVKNIIRIGTCGVIDKSVDIPEVILADKAFTLSNFAYQFCKSNANLVYPSEKLTNAIKLANEKLNVKLHFGGIMTMDVFGPYIDAEYLIAKAPANLNLLGEEMEAFGLLTVAQKLGGNAAVMATAVDSKYSDVVLTPEQRQNSLNDMIILALEGLLIND
ncbi:MAG: purine-nucleoside phosphorylase [Bacilli bacterium]|nr:purine-nucleoside phosphorylase [Bacilli bacterium]